MWGHIKGAPGAWVLAPFALAAAPKVENQAAMVALGRPGAGQALLLNAAGFTDVERVDIPFVFEFADPEAYARALASTGPAYEAIQGVGEAEFSQAAADLAREHIRDGLPAPSTHRRGGLPRPQANRALRRRHRLIHCHFPRPSPRGSVQSEPNPGPSDLLPSAVHSPPGGGDRAPWGTPRRVE